MMIVREGFIDPFCIMTNIGMIARKHVANALDWYMDVTFFPSQHTHIAL